MYEKIINLPLKDEDIKNLTAGDTVLLSGYIITGRDAAHKRLYNSIKLNEKLPVNIKNQVIYYVGPTPAKPGNIVGSAGPTTSYRMDKYTPTLLDNGLVGMIGKGSRSEEVISSIIKNKGIYFAAIGGAAALISKSIKSEEVLCYEDLGPEAIRKYKVENFPCIVAIDSRGNNIYNKGGKKQ